MIPGSDSCLPGTHTAGGKDCSLFLKVYLKTVAQFSVVLYYPGLRHRRCLFYSKFTRNIMENGLGRALSGDLNYVWIIQNACSLQSQHV